MIQLMVIGMITQMQAGITNTCFSFFYPIACIYLGSTRSLMFFDLHKEEEQEENKSTISMILHAVSIPIVFSVALVSIYQCMSMEWTYALKAF